MERSAITALSLARKKHRHTAARVLSRDPSSRKPDEISKLAEQMGHLDFFRKLPTHLLSQLCCVMQLEYKKQGSVIFQQGEEGDKFYVILSGEVAIHIRELPPDGVVEDLEGVDAEDTSPMIVARHSSIGQSARRRNTITLAEPSAHCQSVSSAEGSLEAQTPLQVLPAPPSEEQGEEAQRRRKVRGILKRVIKVLGFEDEDDISGSYVDSRRCMLPSPRSSPRKSNAASPVKLHFGGQGMPRCSSVASLGGGPRTTERRRSEPELPATHEIARLQRGAAFGEAALQSGNPRTATTRATKDTHLAVLTKEEYHTFFSGAITEEKRARVEFLSSVPMFESAGLEVCESLAGLMNRRVVARNEVVQDMNSVVLQAFFVCDGKFELLCSAEPPPAASPSPSAAEQQLRTRSQKDSLVVTSVLLPGMAFGLTAYMRGERRHTSQVVCRVAGSVYFLLARVLVAALPRELRQMLISASVAELRFQRERAMVMQRMRPRPVLRNKTVVIGKDHPAGRASAALPADLYSPEGRLHAIKAGLSIGNAASQPGEEPMMPVWSVGLHAMDELEEEAERRAVSKASAMSRAGSKERVSPLPSTMLHAYEAEKEYQGDRRSAWSCLHQPPTFTMSSPHSAKSRSPSKSALGPPGSLLAPPTEGELAMPAAPVTGASVWPEPPAWASRDSSPVSPERLSEAEAVAELQRPAGPRQSRAPLLTSASPIGCGSKAASKQGPQLEDSGDDLCETERCHLATKGPVIMLPPVHEPAARLLRGGPRCRRVVLQAASVPESARKRLGGPDPAPSRSPGRPATLLLPPLACVAAEGGPASARPSRGRAAELHCASQRTGSDKRRCVVARHSLAEAVATGDPAQQTPPSPRPLPRAIPPTHALAEPKPGGGFGASARGKPAGGKLAGLFSPGLRSRVLSSRGQGGRGAALDERVDRQQVYTVPRRASLFRLGEPPQEVTGS